MSKLVLIIGVIAAAVVLAAVSDRPGPPAALTFIDSADFLSLDPQRVSHMQDIRLIYSLHEGLTRYDVYSKDFEVVPALARSWEVSPDKLVYTFHLEPTARWSNGDPVRASDFVYTWQRALMPETAADYSGMLMHLKGARAFFEFRQRQLAEYAQQPRDRRTPETANALREAANLQFRKSVGVEAVDDHTLKVTLDRPVAYFLELTTFAVMCPVHPASVEQFVAVNADTGEVAQDHGWTKPPYHVCNGPYVLKQWRFKRETRLELNEHYWNKGAIKSKSVRVIPIEDSNTSVLAFESGAADWDADVTAEYIPEMLEQVKRGERDDFAAFPTFGTYFWNFNCTPTLPGGRANPFHDPRVRRAFAMATNKQDIVDKVKRGGERTSDVFVPRDSIKGYSSPKGLRYAPGAARELLTQAGWHTGASGELVNGAGETFPEVELLCTAIQYHKDVALALGRMWEQNLGVRSRVSITEAKSFKDRLRKRDYMIARGSWWGDYGDPTTFLNVNRSDDGNNDRGYASPAYDGLLDAAEKELDPGKRLGILSRAEQLLVEQDLPLLPIFQHNYYYLFHPPEKNGRPNPGGLRGISTHPRLLQYYWQMEVVPAGGK